MHGWTTDSELLFENETWYLLLYNQLKGEIWQKLQRNFFIFSGKYSQQHTLSLTNTTGDQFLVISVEREIGALVQARVKPNLNSNSPLCIFTILFF